MSISNSVFLIPHSHWSLKFFIISTVLIPSSLMHIRVVLPYLIWMSLISFLFIPSLYIYCHSSLLPFLHSDSWRWKKPLQADAGGVDQHGEIFSVHLQLVFLGYWKSNPFQGRRQSVNIHYNWIEIITTIKKESSWHGIKQPCQLSRLNSKPDKWCVVI